MKKNEYRIEKKIIDIDNYNGFKLRFRDAFADRYVMRDMLTRDYNRIPANPNIVVDIGAHIGLFTLSAIKAGAEKVYAFEPEAFNYELLCHNIKINNLENRVVCINKGVGKRGKTKLYIHPTNSGGSSVRIELVKALDYDKFQLINLISVHDLFDDYDIKDCDLLKIDCEGSEREIISDLDSKLISRIRQISLEIHDKKLINWSVDKLKKWYEEAECTNLDQRHKGGNLWIFK